MLVEPIIMGKKTMFLESRHNFPSWCALFGNFLAHFRGSMLTQRALFAIAPIKKGMLSQHFVTHVGPPLETLEMTNS